MLMTGAAGAQSSAPNINAGVSAYRAGDFAKAWDLLEAGAKAGSTKAQRYLGYVILEGHAPGAAKADLHAGAELLKQAALAGDNVALVRLEDLRRQQLAHSPTLQDMIDIETARAGDGDPVSAWRLAKRYEIGEGVAASKLEEAKWLEVAASAESARFPKAEEAAFRLCQLKAMGEEAGDPGAARRWCGMAAERGHAGAVIVLRRLASLQG
jgi:TPR repeat protein